MVFASVISRLEIISKSFYRYFFQFLRTHLHRHTQHPQKVRQPHTCATLHLKSRGAVKTQNMLYLIGNPARFLLQLPFGTNFRILLPHRVYRRVIPEAPLSTGFRYCLTIYISLFSVNGIMTEASRVDNYIPGRFFSIGQKNLPFFHINYISFIKLFFR